MMYRIENLTTLDVVTIEADTEQEALSEYLEGFDESGLDDDETLDGNLLIERG
jgi:hypothetical protein